jgi:DNA-binding NtrC family response regulator
LAAGRSIVQEKDMQSSQSAKFRIFVVDDEYVIATTLATILQRSGFDAVSFTEPMKALDAARQDPPDLLISDVLMPVLSGVDLSIRMRQEYPECKVLLFSGQAATANLLEAARDRGHDFELLSKPIHPTEFLQKVRLVTEQVAS